MNGCEYMDIQSDDNGCDYQCKLDFDVSCDECPITKARNKAFKEIGDIMSKWRSIPCPHSTPNMIRTYWSCKICRKKYIFPFIEALKKGDIPNCLEEGPALHNSFHVRQQLPPRAEAGIEPEGNS